MKIATDPLVLLYHDLAPEQRRMAQAYARCMRKQQKDVRIIQASLPIMQNHQDIFILTNTTGQIIYFSWSAEQLFKYPPEQLLYRSIYETIGRSHKNRDIAWAWERLCNGETISMETEAVCANGEVIPVRVEKVPLIENGELLGKCCRIRLNELIISKR